MESRAKREIEIHKEASKGYSLREEEEKSRFYNIKEYEKMLELCDLSNNPRIIELGSGTCLSYAVIQKKLKNFEYKGVDISKEMLKIGEEKYGDNKNFEVESMNLDKEFKFDKKYNIYLIRSLIHHLDNKERFLDNLLEEMPNDSYLIISEPSKNILTHLLRELIKKIKTKHFDKDHKDLSVKFFKNYFNNKNIKILKKVYFGYLAYPFGFPDLLKLKCSFKTFKVLFNLDEKISKIPILNRLGWKIIHLVKK